MSTSLRNRAAAGGREAAERLRVALWPIMQTSAAAGVAWYLTHDVLAHPQPFFAPISAVVCMSATNVLRARRAAQMIVGVTLGIVVGGAVEAVLGNGWLAFSVAVLAALGFAVLIGRGFIAQGLMFVNQSGVSAILVLVFAHSGGLVAERLFDALIGGGLAFVFSILLFPANPVTVLTAARASVLTALHDTLVQIALVINDPERADPEWPLSCVDRLHNQLGGLIEARSAARLIVRRAPLRAAMRDTIATVDHHAARLGLIGQHGVAAGQDDHPARRRLVGRTTARCGRRTGRGSVGGRCGRGDGMRAPGRGPQSCRPPRIRGPGPTRRRSRRDCPNLRRGPSGGHRLSWSVTVTASRPEIP